MFVVKMRQLSKGAKFEYLISINELPYAFTSDINKAQRFDSASATAATLKIYTYYSYHKHSVVVEFIDNLK